MIPSQPWLSPKLRLAPVEGRGRGLVALEPIDPGEVLVVWGGPTYGDRGKAERALVAGIGTMQWDEDLFSVAGDDHPAYSINHSCDPNAWLVGAFTIVARRPMVPGEEATADYATWIADETYRAPWPCRCGAANCRQTITGMDWRLPKLQAAYRGHFSPLIADRVSRATSVGKVGI